MKLGYGWGPVPYILGMDVDYLGWLSLMSTLEEILVAQRFRQWTHVCLMDNGVSFDIFVGKTILYG
jgi:hypothetical protein